MTTNNNMHVITNEIVWIRQLHFAHATFFLSSEVSVVFNISSSHYNTNLPITFFTGAIFSIQKQSKYQIFFPMWVFFHEHSRITELQGKAKGISLTPYYHFHPLHRHLDISRAITAESSPLRIAILHALLHS